jgi:hypothetical protein
MPNLIGLGAGAGATALTLILGLAFWPHIEKAPTPGKAMVSQPIFVTASAPAKSQAGTAPAATPPTPASTPTPTQAAAEVPVDAALAKLAIALKSDTSTVAASNAGATRSMTIAAASRSTLAPAPASEAARRLCAQGLVALAAGDITGARLYLERAAEAGDARALMVLGTSYDPATLARMGAVGIKGDAARARDYYAKALAAGMGAARDRMATLDAP